jgi:hypothetical protein
MSVAMFAGMMTLQPLWEGIQGLPPWARTMDADCIAMALTMTAGVGVFMRLTQQSRRDVLEMSAAMCVPWAPLLALDHARELDDGALMIAGHIGMFAAMFLVMVRHRSSFTAPRPAYVLSTAASC